jgi:nucleoside-diphosphate-sugar epimerase
MDVAITGANGFVGLHLTRHLARAGLKVEGLVRTSRAARSVEAAGGRPVEIDLGDPPALARALSGARALVHLAQIGAEHGRDTYEEVNVRGVARTVAAAHSAGVSRIIFLSGLGVARYGQSRRVTNRYFLSKLAAELELFRSGLGVTVFRPSYIVGAGDAFLPALVDEMASGSVEVPGDGAYRMQPVAVSDVCALVHEAIDRGGLSGSPKVFDLVGPEAVSFTAFLQRFGAVAREAGKVASWRVEHVPVEAAEAKARAGGYRGMLPDELDCMLCDEVADAAPLEQFLGRPLVPLDEALRMALRLVSAAGPL